MSAAYELNSGIAGSRTPGGWAPIVGFIPTAEAVGFRLKLCNAGPTVRPPCVTKFETKAHDFSRGIKPTAECLSTKWSATGNPTI